MAPGDIQEVMIDWFQNVPTRVSFRKKKKQATITSSRPVSMQAAHSSTTQFSLSSKGWV